MAKLRYERQMLEERLSRTGGDQQTVESIEDTMSDASTNAPLTPIQGGDGRWNQAQNAEPYMRITPSSLTPTSQFSLRLLRISITTEV